MTEPSPPSRRYLWIALAVIVALGGAIGFKPLVQKITHNYLVTHPEVLTEAMAALQKKESAKQLAPIRAEVERVWPGQVLGNPDGKITLVEFSDFGCTYCRSSVEDVEAMVAANKDLKVVIRQLPILSPESADAARMGMAAAEQGKYALFHKAMFTVGKPDARSIEAAARAAGVDLVRAAKIIADPRLELELNRNVEFARQLGFNGTPSWVVGDELISGAVGRERLEAAIKGIGG